MELTNKTEIHPADKASKSSCANSPRCSSCGTRAYVPANCCGVFYPPFPNCRTNVESGKGSDPQQPCFFNPGFLQPIFHNGLAPQNCCTYGGVNINSSSKTGNKDSADHECEHLRMKATFHMHCQKLKKNPSCDKTGEKNGVSEYEPTSMTQSQTEETQCNFHACNCGATLQWPCTSLVVPIMSYCVLWNHQNQNNCVSNHCCGHMENFNRKSEEAEGNLYSKTGNKENYHGASLEKGLLKKEKEREQNISSSSFLSLHSSANDENKIYNIKKQISSFSLNIRSDDNSEEEETTELQTKRSVSSCSSQNHSSEKSKENVLSNVVDYFARNKNQRSSSVESDSDLKAEDSSVEPDEADDQIKCLHIYSGENVMPISSKTTSSESVAEKKPEVNKSPDAGSYTTSKTTTKKLIKNFTVTSRIDSALHGKPKASAAAGDVGGETCVGYKVNIESEETQFENIEGDTKQNVEPRRSVTIGSEEKKSSSADKTQIDSKTFRAPRTGIAKLIQEKNVTKENKEPVSNDKKRRILSNESRAGEEISKFRNEKSRGTQQHKTGPEKQNPTLNSNSRNSKRDEKFPVPKVRPHNCERSTGK